MARGDTDRNLVAALCYIPFLSVVLSIVILYVERDDKYVRFHAFQALFISIAYYLLSILLGFVAKGFLSFLSGIISPLWTIIFLVIWLVSAVEAFKGKLFKWPIVGRHAEKQVR